MCRLSTGKPCGWERVLLSDAVYCAVDFTYVCSFKYGVVLFATVARLFQLEGLYEALELVRRSKNVWFAILALIVVRAVSWVWWGLGFGGAASVVLNVDGTLGDALTRTVHLVKPRKKEK